MSAPFSFETRAAHIDRMALESFDVLVIGGGITGAGIAREAAMRGLTTALVDQDDFGGGTSSHSSRLVHGGLRYLEHGQFRLVFQASHERRVLLDIAPHLVWPQSFLFPIHAGGRVGRLRLAAGLWLYDLLAAFRNVRRHQRLSKRALIRAEPGIRTTGLRGGARYWDAQCDDARLTLANVRAAHRHGACVANYVRAERFDRAEGWVRGAHLVDLLTGRRLAVRARCVVNASGPWSEELCGALGGVPPLLLTKGAHVLVPRHRVGNREALTLTSPIDGRVMFVVPWGPFSYIGTTETALDAPVGQERATGADVVYLLRSVNAYFPEARLTPDDVVSTWAGVRTLVRRDGTRDPGAASREHAIVQTVPGLWSIVGGKLTTYRRMARETVDRVAARLHEFDGRPQAAPAPTDREPLPGGEARDHAALVEGLVADGCARALAEHLARRYGTEAAAVVRLARQPALARPVVSHHPTVWAEFRYALEAEMAMRLTDLLIRRTRLCHETPDHALSVLDDVADFASQYLGWDAARRADEISRYRREVERIEAFRRDLASPAGGL